MKLFVSLISVTCVNASALCTLKYPNWQQKKSNRTHLYLLSVAEERTRPHIGRRSDIVNVDRHTRRAITAMGVACKQPASTTTVKNGEGRRRGRCSICTPQQLRKEEQAGNVAGQIGCARTILLSRQFKQNVAIARNNQNTDKFQPYPVLNSILWSTKIVCISLYIVEESIWS